MPGRVGLERAANRNSSLSPLQMRPGKKKKRRAARERKKRTDSSKVGRGTKKRTRISKPSTFGNSLLESFQNQYTFGNSLNAFCSECAFAGALNEKKHKKKHTKSEHPFQKSIKKTSRSRRHGRFWTRFCFRFETLLKNFRAAEIRIKKMLQKKKFF